MLNINEINRLNNLVSNPDSLDHGVEYRLLSNRNNEDGYGLLHLRNAKNRCVEYYGSFIGFDTTNGNQLLLTQETIPNDRQISIPYLVKSDIPPEGIIQELRGDSGHPGEPHCKLDFEFGQFIGIFLGDGWWDHRDYGREERALYVADLKGYNARYVLRILKDKLGFDRISLKIFENRKTSEDDGRYGDSDKYVIKFPGSTLFSQWMGFNFGGERSQDSAGSKNKRIAEWVYDAPLEFQLGVLNGLVSTDGTIVRANTPIGNLTERVAMNISSTSPELIKGLERISKNLGIKFKTSFNKITVRGNTAYTYAPNLIDCRMINAFDRLADEEKRSVWKTVKIDTEQPSSKRYDTVMITDNVLDEIGKYAFNAKIESLHCSEALIKKARSIRNITTEFHKIKSIHLVSRYMADRLLNMEDEANEFRRDLFKESKLKTLELMGVINEGVNCNMGVFNELVEAIRMLISATLPNHKLLPNELNELRNSLLRSATTLNYRAKKKENNIDWNNLKAKSVGMNTIIRILTECDKLGPFQTNVSKFSEILKSWKRDIVDNPHINWDILDK